MQLFTTLRLAGLVGSGATVLLLGACASQPTMGDQSAKGVGTGAAAGATAVNANVQLAHCDQPYGTVALLENTQSDGLPPGYAALVAMAQSQGRQVPAAKTAMRLLIQQSNCFVVVERGAGFVTMQQERQLAKDGELRTNANMGKGQIVAADYAIAPQLLFQASSGGGGVVGFIPFAGLIAGAMKKSSAQAIVTLVDNRNGVQVSVAEGSSSDTDFSVGTIFVGGLAGAAGTYTSTPEGKVAMAAMTDSFNNMMAALSQYKPQQVSGSSGLGGGGKLPVAR
jgi:hypothetical protein